MVPGCKTNYKNRERESVFRFPRNPEIRNAWLKEIPRENYTITNSSRVSVLLYNLI